ncbi:MAG: glutathione S-transferase N-terminal domain-containing protein [Deltaproteobacteria bacterium]|nr:glutathione S-transferase N-terminal domain-containing protein [Deltaproteobacteria bacterium]
MSEGPLRIVGAPGSPYSRKLRAVLRYRRIPYAWINQGSPETHGLPQPRVHLLAAERAAVDALLAGTGCEHLFH